MSSYIEINLNKSKIIFLEKYIEKIHSAHEELNNADNGCAFHPAFAR